MNVILFGATGLAGSAILQQLLQTGYNVTAFIRTPSKVSIQQAALKLVAGDVLSLTDVSNAIAGHDAVVSAISEGPKIQHHTQSKGIQNIIEAMQESGLQRIVAMGSFGILQLNDHQLVRDVDYPAEYYPISEEQFQVFQQLSKTNLQWTQVCPPMILDKAADGHYLTQKEVPIKNKTAASAGNIGAFIAQEIKENKYLQTRVAIANA